METTLAPPEAPPTDPLRTADSPRRRRWRFVILVAVLLLTAGITAAIAELANYQPIGPGSFGFALDTPLRHKDVDVSWVNTPARRLWHVWAGRGDSFTYELSIRNDGRLPVTVRGIGDPENDRSLTWTPTGVAANPYVGGHQRLEPFHPFTLGSGDEALLEIRVDVNFCNEVGNATGWTSLPMEYTVLGIPRHDLVPLGDAFAIHGTDGSCP